MNRTEKVRPKNLTFCFLFYTLNQQDHGNSSISITNLTKDLYTILFSS